MAGRAPPPRRALGTAIQTGAVALAFPHHGSNMTMTTKTGERKRITAHLVFAYQQTME
jgi:hypothetical protein